MLQIGQVGGQKIHLGPPGGSRAIQVDIHLVGVVRLVAQVDFGQVGSLGNQKSSPYLARWNPRVSRDCTAKSRIDCAILAKIAHLAGRMCLISPVPPLL